MTFHEIVAASKLGTEFVINDRLILVHDMGLAGDRTEDDERALRAGDQITVRDLKSFAGGGWHVGYLIRGNSLPDYLLSARFAKVGAACNQDAVQALIYSLLCGTDR
jgi:hypothetical protein